MNAALLSSAFDGEEPSAEPVFEGASVEGVSVACEPVAVSEDVGELCGEDMGGVLLSTYMKRRTRYRRGTHELGAEGVAPLLPGPVVVMGESV